MEYQNVTIFLFTSFKVIIFCQLYETKFNFDAMKPNTALPTLQLAKDLKILNHIQ